MTDRQPANRLRRHVLWLALPLLGAILAGAYMGWLRRAPAPVSESGGPVLIVLPLHPDGARHDEGVLAEGLSRELIARLGRINGLRTIASASSLRAGAEHLDATQLARRVGATHVLEGELRELGGDQLHLDLRLLAAPGARALWSQAYDRKLADIGALEHEVAQSVARTLRLPLVEGHTAQISIDPPLLREYLEARQLVDSPQRARGVDLLRDVVAKAPQFARAHAALARTLTSTLRGTGDGASADLDEAVVESNRALELDQNLAEAHTALAVLACRVTDWARCMESFQRALMLAPGDAESRISYAYWLAALGYIDRALSEAETAWKTDPLSYNAIFARARLFDTSGRHNEAARLLDDLNAESGGLVYAKWHNAVWRGDFTAAAQLTAAMPRGDGFREAYTVVTEALSEPRLWPQALPLIDTSERANGGINVLRIMMPNPDYGVVIVGLEKMLRDGWPSYYMLLWMPEYAAMRRDPAFQDFLKRTRLLEYWREHGFPVRCHADGDGAACN